MAVLAGWYVTEIGRQPWIVYGELAVADVVADHSQGVMRGTLLAYALLYVALLAAYVATLRHLSAKPAASLQMHAAARSLAGGRRSRHRTKLVSACGDVGAWDYTPGAIDVMKDKRLFPRSIWPVRSYCPKFTVGCSGYPV